VSLCTQQILFYFLNNISALFKGICNLFTRSFLFLFFTYILLDPRSLKILTNEIISYLFPSFKYKFEECIVSCNILKIMRWETMVWVNVSKYLKRLKEKGVTHKLFHADNTNHFTKYQNQSSMVSLKWEVRCLERHYYVITFYNISVKFVLWFNFINWILKFTC